MSWIHIQLRRRRREEDEEKSMKRTGRKNEKELGRIGQRRGGRMGEAERIGEMVSMTGCEGARAENQERGT